MQVILASYSIIAEIQI